MADAALADELLVLSSIYGDELTRLSDRAFTIRLSSSLTLRFDLPSSYPDSPPAATFRADGMGLTDDDVKAARARTEVAWTENRGEVCCYQMIEAVRSEVERIQERRGQQATDAASLADAALHRRAPSDDGQLDGVGVEERGAGDWDEPDDGEAVEDKAEEWQRKKAAALAATAAPATGHSDAESSPSPFVSGPAYTDHRSVFVAHVAPLSSPASLPSLLAHIHSHPKLSRATHNMYAYRISSPTYTQSGCEDDGEDRAGGRLLHLLDAMGVANALVVVSRWYGGVKLGAERFRIINNVARELLEAEGYHGQRKGDRGGKGKGKREQSAR